MGVTLEKQIACARRELGIRERVYPTWVESGRMADITMKRELDGMRAIVETLEGLRRPWDGIDRRQPMLELTESVLHDSPAP